MRAYSILLLSLFIITPSGILCSQQEPHTVIDMPLKKKERIIGSAWQQAIQHVYIASSDTPTQPQRIIEKPKEPTPQPLPPRPEYIHHPEPTPEQPSPEEVEMLLANLQHVLSSLEEDDDIDEAYIYYDDASDDNDIPMNFSQFMHAIHGGQQ